jgi:SNF2 family DNA or RNA helicase
MEFVIIDDDDTVYTKSYLETLEYTDLLRLASQNKSAEEYIEPLRGVAIEDKYTLFDYQISALDWMRDREKNVSYGITGGIICMEMGMGKTLVGLIHTLSQPRGIGPTLIIASKTVMIEWKIQGVDKFLKYSNVLYLHPDFMSKNAISNLNVEALKKYDIVITTYDVCITATKMSNVHEECFEYGDEHSLMKDKIVSIRLRPKKNVELFRQTGICSIYGLVWERVICDESQKFANYNTKVYHSMMAICANYRWCLSGTPIRNYDTDIWAQLRFCGYTTIDRAPDWKKRGALIFAANNLDKCVYMATYTKAGIQLPKKTEIDVFVELSENQKIIYTKFLKKMTSMYKQMMEGHVEFACVMGNFVRLRQCAIAPYLMCSQSKRTSQKRPVENTKTNFSTDVTTDSDMFEWKETDVGMYSPKIIKIIDIIKQIPQSEKVCFFTTFTSYSDLLAASLDKLLPNCKYLQLDGDTIGSDRRSTLDTFRSDPSMRILLLTYKVGGEGLNLIEATHCIFGEPWWSSAVLRQAKARVWRSGQTKPVFIYNVISKSTIEERVLEICKDKEEMTCSFLNDSSDNSANSTNSTNSTNSVSKIQPKDMGLTKIMMGRILKMA